MDWTENTISHLCKMDHIDINITDVRGQAPLFAAVKYNHTDNLELLCKFGADPNGSTMHAESPVHIAVRDGFFGVLKILLENGASPDGYDSTNKPMKREHFGTIPVSYSSLVNMSIISFLG